MRFKAGLLVIVAFLISTFLILNWRMFATPASFNFLLGSIDIPIGFVIVGLLLVVGITFGIYVGLWQRTMLNDYRRQSRELQAQRTLADNAEASRFTALSNLMREELVKLEQRFELALDSLRGEVHATERSIAAMLAEMDDRMRQSSGTSQLPRAAP